MDHILIVGGGSRLGRSIAAMADVPCTRVLRTNAKAGDIVVDDYTHIAETAFRNVSVVINVTGLVHSSVESLHATNVALPRMLAEQAKASGVNHFVQISSFSIFGHAQTIAADTACQPVSPYGQSRLAGEAAVTNLAGPAFSVMRARLPMLYGYGDSKLEQLVRFWLRFRSFPAPSRPISRSMLHYDLAAKAILASLKIDGPLNFADPTAFEYGAAARILSVGAGKTVRTIGFPLALANAAKHRVPILRSIYSDNILLPEANRVVALGLPSRLHNDLKTMATGQ